MNDHTTAWCARSIAVLAGALLVLAAPGPSLGGPADVPWHESARPLAGSEGLTALVEEAAAARLVLLGEASHGTHEFYTYRTEIARRLISLHGFNFIAVEGDWELCQILNSYILDLPDAPASAREALLTFNRWPLWMWANEEIVELAEWLREWNDQQALEQKVGFYGMDVYGMWDSLDAVLDYVREHHAEKLPRVEELYSGLQRFHGDGHAYARSLLRDGRSSADQTRQVVAKLQELPEPESAAAQRRRFMATQNAWVVKYGERHFRAMTTRGAESWNQRVEHMKKTVARLLDRYGAESRGMVWAHNTHVGDARATTMIIGGQTNIGQLARQRWGGDTVYSVGFATYEGTVMAGRSWGDTPRVMELPQGMPGSLERLLAETFTEDVVMLLGDVAEDSPLAGTHGHRAVGVVYDPNRESLGNYVRTRVLQRYDALIYLRRTQALRPLHETQ